MIDREKLLDLLEEQGLSPHFVEAETEILSICPNCDALKLYTGSDEGMYICFHCGEQGSLLELLTKMIGMDTKDSLRTERSLREGGPKPTSWERLKPSPPIQQDIVRLPSNMIPFSALNDNAILLELSLPYVNYLESRGVTTMDAANYGMGFILQGRYKDRIIIPVTYKKRLYTFVARTILSKDSQVKVLYPANSHPGDVAFNADFVRGADRVVIVEGVFDALRLQHEAVALLGSKISPKQVSIIRELGPAEVVVCLDGDETGRAGAKEVAQRLISAMPKVEVSIAHLPDGTDPGSANYHSLTVTLDTAEPFVF